jgi:hypothetical protein
LTSINVNLSNYLPWELDFGTNLDFFLNKVIGFQQSGSHLGENNQCCFQNNYHLIWYQSNLIVKIGLKFDLRIMGLNESYPTLQKTYLHPPPSPKRKNELCMNAYWTFSLVAWNYYFQNCLSPFIIWANGEGTNPRT